MNEEKSCKKVAEKVAIESEDKKKN